MSYISKYRIGNLIYYNDEDSFCSGRVKSKSIKEIMIIVKNDNDGKSITSEIYTLSNGIKFVLGDSNFSFFSCSLLEEVGYTLLQSVVERKCGIKQAK